MFPGYTYPVILDLPYDLWVLLALAFDDYVEDVKRQRSRLRR